MKTQSQRRYWRSLDELRQTPEFEQFLHREFPVAASEYPEGVSRRRWLQLMGASLAMAGTIGCRYPEETIAPFVIRPEGRVPGEPYLRATNFELADRVHHLLVSCVDGRPLKIEGNPDHPASGGGTDLFAQASILGLYDPDRASEVVRRVGGKREASEWGAFEAYARPLVAGQSAGRVAVLMPPTQSPSLVRMVAELRRAVPDLSLCVYDSVRGGADRQAMQAAFGQPVRPLLELDKTRVIFALESDLVGQHPGFVRNARRFSAGRNTDGEEMNRLYVAEAGFSATGMSADARLALRPSQMPAFLAALEERVEGIAGGAAEAVVENELPFDELDPQEKLERFLDVLARDLVGARGESLVVVGEHLGPEAVAAGVRLNSKLENIGRTLLFLESADAGLGETVDLTELVAGIQSGEVGTLLVLGGNPVFTAPADVPLAEAIARVENSIYLGEYDDETGFLCQWSLPAAHPLESWGDCFGDEGHYGVCQPHILPLLNGRTALEVIAGMLGADERTGEAIVRRTADQVAGGSLSDREWRQLLHDGYREGLGVSPVEVTFSGGDEPIAEPTPVATDAIDIDSLELVFVPADGVYDGRFANNGWLQEMPQRVTKLTWDNAAIMSPRTARELGVHHGVMAAFGDDALELPVYEIPGVAPGVVVVPYGYGRTRAGVIGGFRELDIEPVGFDVQPLRTTETMQIATGVRGRPRRHEYVLATTQDHWAIDPLGREEAEDRSYQLVREGTKDLYRLVEDFAQYLGVHKPEGVGSLWKEPIDTIEEERPELPQWGMSIDLTKCLGCNACVIACQSENNVPIVGKEQVAMGREMHWLRIDRYFQGDEDHADVVQQPMLCQHCETAPCESVCPVAATMHTDDGINAMAYNRCIGTRYCANNCPYKVRRFNYFNWNEDVGVGYGIDAFPSNIEKANRKLKQLVLNPEVTVRGRGVMEKCTFCIQRVEAGKIEAIKDGRRGIRDGDVQTACQQACPSGAIQFGNIADENSAVSKQHHNPRAYAMLDQLNTKPRNLYLARIRNTPPRLMTSTQLLDLKRLPEIAAHHHAGHGDGGHGEEGHGEGHGEGGHGEESHDASAPAHEEHS
ncbi:TAT-variant-translocated molybdopterin oxidoreductase [Candidatus Laterigemmans baculatus]|nr:TAT-variant-translocated molybdopterin oxidoreductase [Candidatus Laterigemmans baculatus]